MGERAANDRIGEGKGGKGDRDKEGDRSVEICEGKEGKWRKKGEFVGKEYTR